MNSLVIKEFQCGTIKKPVPAADGRFDLAAAFELEKARSIDVGPAGGVLLGGIVDDTGQTKAQFLQALLNMCEPIQVQGAPVGAAPGWTGPKPYGYSDFLSTSWGLHTPFEQYGLYGTTLASLSYSALSWKRAHILMLASMEPDAALARNLMLEANAKEFDVTRAVNLASKFRTRGLLAAIGAPMLWLGFMTATSAPKRKRAA